MNVTVIGKTLAFVAVALSLLLFGFALGIYSNHIDWPGGLTTVYGDRSKGRLPALTEEFKRWEGEATLARQRCDKASQLLARLESQRPEDQKWYEAQLKVLEEGAPNETMQQAVLREAKTGQPEVDSQSHPLLEPAAGVRFSRRGYRDEFNRLKDDTQAAIRAATDLVNQQKQLTQIINGEEGKQRGLRALIQEEELAQRSSAEELQHLKPQRINRQVEGELLQKRHRALSARLEELKRGAAGTPVTALDSAVAPGHTPRP